jgi:predicted naringenin-chalcone synthase
MPPTHISQKTNLMNANDVFIVEIEKIIPTQYSPNYVADRLYPEELYGTDINRLAKKLASKFGIQSKSSVIDYELYPQIVLTDTENQPLNWGITLIDKLCTTVAKSEIGFFALNYNISPHVDILPNLASQISKKAGLNNLDYNEEIPYYGCASSVYALEKAVEYCKQYNRPAIVFTFDQCTVGCIQSDAAYEDFNKMLVSNLLFADAGVAMLIIPASMRERYEKPVIKIEDIETKYEAGDLIVMRNRNFLMSSDLKKIMPRLVSDILVKPFLEKHNLDIADVDEWSIHQGGREVLRTFCEPEVLGLSDKQVEESMKKFNEYGNTSSASCMLVLESFFNDDSLIHSSRNCIMLGFGAGYYLGILLYQWDYRSPSRLHN